MILEIECPLCTGDGEVRRLESFTSHYAWELCAWCEGYGFIYHPGSRTFMRHLNAGYYAPNRFEVEWA